VSAEITCTVDRILKDHVVLIQDSGDELVVERGDLPATVREGDVLRIPLNRAGKLNWAAARIDAEETARRRREGRSILKDLRRRDPGGDIEL
jgi:hypothetical protein